VIIMGTKNNPGKFDCYSAAHPDEPMFVLLGRDPSAWLLVALWAEIRAVMGEDPDKVQEARQCANALARWAIAQGKQQKISMVAVFARGYVNLANTIGTVDASVLSVVKPPSTPGMREGNGEDRMKFIRELSGTIEEQLLDDRFFFVVCLGLIAIGFALDAWSCR
jgi:hypothetical protein